MNAFLRAALVLALVSPLAAWAQSYVPIEQRLSAGQLRTIGLTPEQLEQLNRMLRQAQETQGDAAMPTVATVAEREPPHEGRDRSSLIGFNDEPIHSRLKGAVSAWEPGAVFELENGQQWKVLKGRMKLPRTLDAPEIMVIPGVAGRWFLQVHEDFPKARVYRID